MGIDNVVGSLTPGKRADLIMIDTRHVNLAVRTDPAHLLVEAAQPANATAMTKGRESAPTSSAVATAMGNMIATAALWCSSSARTSDAT